MKKSIKILVTAGIMMATMSMSAFAGEWKQDPGRPAEQNGISNWWYQNDDGSYTKGGSQWIDGKCDGISENYYFDEDGWLLINTTITGGGRVNENGAVIDPYSGEVITMAAEEEKSITGVFYENGIVYDYLHNADLPGKCINIMPVWTNNVMDGTYRLTVDQETGSHHFRWVYTFRYSGNNQELVAELQEGPGGNLLINFDGKDTVTIQDGSEKTVYIRPEYGDMEEDAEEDALYFEYWGVEG